MQSHYGEPETINLDVLNKKRSVAAIKSYIQDRPGLFIFRHADLRVPPPVHKFEHTELWDGNHFLQQDMAVNALVASPRVLM